MLKLNASYSKKVPAEGEYSSQSYHASIEVELPDGLNQEQLQNRIHETFAMVRESVESELHGRPAKAEPASQNTAAKQPTASSYYTVRTEDDLQKFIFLAQQIEKSIQSGLFYPNENCMNCSDCPYKKQCKNVCQKGVGNE